MYAGSSGVLFSLYRYGLLLIRETPDLMPYWLTEELTRHIRKNHDLADELHR
jgi:hypothetical protein